MVEESLGVFWSLTKNTGMERPNQAMPWAVLAPSNCAKQVKIWLEEHGYRDNKLKISPLARQQYVIEDFDAHATALHAFDYVVIPVLSYCCHSLLASDSGPYDSTTTEHPKDIHAGSLPPSHPVPQNTPLGQATDSNYPLFLLPVIKTSASTKPHNNPMRAFAQLYPTTPFGAHLAWYDVFVGSEEDVGTALFHILPNKWEHYNNFCLFPDDAFKSTTWDRLFETLASHRSTDTSSSSTDLPIQNFFHHLAHTFRVTHLARKINIPKDDVLRRPEIDPLYGDWGPDYTHHLFHFYRQPTHHMVPPVNHDLQTETFWAHTVQNNVHYTWAPLHTMFSAGNISEKLRVAQSPNFRSGVVVDMYAGIGYFTLPYMLHAGASLVHACELNPWSVEGLRRGAELNGLKVRVVQEATREEVDAMGQERIILIHQGDNAKAVYRFENTADHVNLGLIPSSEAAWPGAVKALKPEGGWLHVHVNLGVGEEIAWQAHLLRSLETLLNAKINKKWILDIVHLERVKSFAPKVYHWVADVHAS
ncbi:hypothetical protein BZG36_04680 [Bifiguratus adelaidae]|uniref:tRNA(Phe) (4-demethylwyosine(37)-C(7)) aminocarboxypropyltransferase n=1 Tax=Bifiguratus adelaidae TaxID=1938954 RepID=A0A261XXA4_9FUNG|nr:hypothetical protein BZG36_04680 [Bifiguratus adelaidae]